jgi:hypothetical protein
MHSHLSAVAQKLEIDSNVVSFKFPVRVEVNAVGIDLH